MTPNAERSAPAAVQGLQWSDVLPPTHRVVRMSSTTHVQAPGDAELISAVRGGDTDAYGQLFERHVGAARRLARQLVSAGDVEDLVSEAFVKVLQVLQRGGGPDVAFRAYLLTAVRRLRVDRLRAASRLHTTDDMEMFDPGVPFRDTAVEGFESATAARAFASLPERWQLVLWHTEVEGQKPADIAPLLGMSANSVSALAYRAREGLRQAYLTQHAADLDGAGCQWARAHLGAYIRDGISRRDAGKVEDHLRGCRACAAIYLELSEVNSHLGAVLAPLLLGGAAAAYTASSAGVAVPTGLLALAGRARDLVAVHSQAAAVVGVTTAVAVTGGGFVAFQHQRPPAAESGPVAGAGAPVSPDGTLAPSASGAPGARSGTGAGTGAGERRGSAASAAYLPGDGGPRRARRARPLVGRPGATPATTDPASDPATDAAGTVRPRPDRGPTAEPGPPARATPTPSRPARPPPADLPTARPRHCHDRDADADAAPRAAAHRRPPAHRGADPIPTEPPDHRRPPRTPGARRPRPGHDRHAAGGQRRERRPDRRGGRHPGGRVRDGRHHRRPGARPGAGRRCGPWDSGRLTCTVTDATPLLVHAVVGRPPVLAADLHRDQRRRPGHRPRRQHRHRHLGLSGLRRGGPAPVRVV